VISVTSKHTLYYFQNVYYLFISKLFIFFLFVVDAYSWYTGDYGVCSAKCNIGSRARPVTCHLNSTGEYVDNDYCKQTVGAQPQSIEVCNTRTCYWTPTAPTINTVIRDSSNVLISFTNSSFAGNAPSLSYYLMIYPTRTMKLVTSNPIILTDLIVGQSYSFTMFASNGDKQSPESTQTSIIKIEIRCVTPPIPVNTNRIIMSSESSAASLLDQSIGATLQYSCLRGYAISGASYSTCTSNGQWSHSYTNTKCIQVSQT
jgi:hypothetical protein